MTSATNDYQDIATYNCDVGYEQSGGNLSRMCDSTGNWTGNALECQSKCFCAKAISILVISSVLHYFFFN